MARTITASTTLTALEFVAQVPEVNNSRFNPVERTSRVNLYAVSDVGSSASFALGSDSHAEDVTLPIGTSVSIRDNLIATGTALAGQKITLSLRDLTIGSVVASQIVIEPLA